MQFQAFSIYTFNMGLTFQNSEVYISVNNGYF